MINKRFADLKTDVGNNVRDTSSASLTIFGGYINEAYQEFLNKTNYENINDDYTFTTTSGQNDYVMPDDFLKEVYVYDDTNDIYLSGTTLQRFAQDYPSSVGVTGTVSTYTVLKRPCRVNLTSASSLTAVSSSPADTSMSIYIRGYLNGVEVTETISLSGATPVSTSSTFDRISKISKSAVTNGNITITAGSLTLGVLSRRIKDYSVNILRLLETPSASLIMSVPYITDFIPMTDDNDCPVIECGDYLIARATAKAWKYKRQFNKSQVYDYEAERHWDEYIWSKDNDPNTPHLFRPIAYNRDIY